MTDKVGDLPERRYAVIIDEAHSSPSGEAAAEMKGVLAADAVKNKVEAEPRILRLPDW